MSDQLCDQLDDYLGGWLDKSARGEFEAHLERCADCRGEVERQRRLDGLLAQAGAHLEPVPPGLVRRVERHLAAAQWRSRAIRAVAGLAAAAVLVLSVLLWPHRPGTAPTVTIRETPQMPRDRAPEEPLITPIDHRVASGELAVLVVSHCGRSCPSAHRWTRMPWIAPPPRFVNAGFAVRVLADAEAEARQVGEVGESPQVVLSTSAEGVSCIRARHTLGTRKVARVVFH